MDPLSIFVSVATLLEVGMRASRELHGVIHTWKSAPPAILALYNEVSDLNLVLDHTQSAQHIVKVKGAKYDLYFLETLDTHLGQSRRLLEDLEVLVLELKDLGVVKKKYKWLWKNSEAADLQQQLREVRVRINELLVAYNVSAVSRIELQIKAVHANLQRNHSAAMQKMTTGGINIQNLTQVQHVTAYQRSSQDSRYLAEKLAKVLGSMSLASGVDELKLEYKVKEVLEKMEHERQYERDSLTSLAASVQRGGEVLAGLSSSLLTKAAPNPTQHRALADQRSSRETSTPTITVTASPRYSNCHGDCKCRCHRLGPPALKLGNELLGRLFVGYSGIPGTASTCGIATCLANNRSSVEISYVFPIWFLHYAISAVFRKTSTGGPSLGLFITKRMAFEPGNILYAAFTSNLEAVRRIVQADPYAVHYAMNHDGRTALHLAIYNIRKTWDFSVVRYLIQQGANPHVMDDVGQSPASNATRLMLEPNKAGGEEAETNFRTLFDTDRYMDSLELSHVTKLILGLRPGNVEKLLASNSPSIREMAAKPDTLGYTPLWWATVAGDAGTVRALLGAGADPNKGMVMENVSPLSRAVNGKSMAVVEALLENGSNIQTRDTYGWQPIHWAVRADNVLAVERFVCLGVDINAEIKGGDECRPVTLAAQHDAVAVLEYLVNRGVDINTETLDSENAVISAVANNSHKCLAWLLQRDDINTAVVLKSEGAGILHMAGQVGDAETMRMLTRVHGYGLDLDARNKSGLTPRELFALRGGEVGELRGPWEDLVASVMEWPGSDSRCELVGEEHRGNYREVGTEEEEEEEEEEDDKFYDAVDKICYQGVQDVATDNDGTDVIQTWKKEGLEVEHVEAVAV